MKRTDRNRSCPVNVAVETLCDSWTLLIVRDIVFYGKRTFGEFMGSPERITTSVLADRLVKLEAEGVLIREKDTSDGRRETYRLSDKGLSLIPLLVELAGFGVLHGSETRRDPLWLEAVAQDREGLCDLIRETVQRGGSVWSGEDSVARQLRAGQR